MDDLKTLEERRNREVTIAAEAFLKVFKKEYHKINNGLKDRRTGEDKEKAREAYRKIADACGQLHRTNAMTKPMRLVGS